MNFERIFQSLKMPELWQRSDAAFWDDEHVSKQMLAAHLDPDIDAASRKAETINISVEWLSSIIGEHSSILDLGCGPGLYTKKLSDMGYHVTGVDYSHRSLDYAKSQDSKTVYRYQNYLELKEREAYDAILLIYCDYAALTLPERRVLLANVFRALKRGGIFIFDVFTDKNMAKQTCENTWAYCENGGFYSAEPYTLLDSAYLYENGTVRAERHTVITADNVTDHIIWDTSYTKDRLLEEIQPSGLRLKQAYDDICGTDYTGESDTLCFVAEKP